MKKHIAIAALTISSLYAGMAHAELGSTVTLTSDYDFRGITQTALKPALQASLDFSHESGFYLGAWASNVDFGKSAKTEAELDLIGGFKGSFAEGFGYDVGVAHYAYLPTKDQVAYNEIYAGVTFKAFSAKYWYSEDFGNTGAPASYIEANASIPLPSDFGVSLHAGHSSGDYWKDAYKRGYTDYSIGVSKTLGQFTATLKWVDGSDLKETVKTPGDVFSTKSKVVFQVATTVGF
ncbi:MAG: TorF family putative porin [Steroidobacteraceae bacterium]|jgi:uncharacterized protein (TIGR02001 family)|nr:hypothetical protein [Gammaproteobacteria bacterium]